MFSVNLQRAESFSHHRIGIDKKDSHEHLVDSKELQETSIAPNYTQSDEQVSGEESVGVLRLRGGESRETPCPSSTINWSLFFNQSIEDSVDSKEIKLVKRDVQFTTTTDVHSSEEDATTVPTISLTDLSVEDDAEDKKKVKRNVQVEMTSIDHSSEEERYAAIVGQMNQSDEHDYE